MFRPDVLRWIGCALAGSALAAQFTTARAAEVTIRVNASTFNQFLGVLQPIAFSGRYRLRTTIDAGILGRHTITWCDSAYAGFVTGLTIDINSSRIRALGDVAFSWCGLSFGAPGRELTAIGDLTYQAANDTLRLRFSSAVVRPTFNVLGNVIQLPVSVDVGPMLNIPPFPIGRTVVAFEMPGGARSLLMEPVNVGVAKGAGFVTISTDVAMN